MSTNAPVQFAIISGPSDRDVMLSFMHMYDKHADVKVVFRIKFERMTWNLIGKIAAVAYDNGARGHFMLELRCPNGKSYKGYYDANKREGWLEMQ